MAEDVAIRALADDDSLEGLTELLHRAYEPLGSRGLNYTAVDQSVDETFRRIAQGMCAVATLGETVVGTVIARGGPNERTTSSWYWQRHVASAHQLAVEPSFQGRGIGSR